MLDAKRNAVFQEMSTHVTTFSQRAAWLAGELADVKMELAGAQTRIAELVAAEKKREKESESANA